MEKFSRALLGILFAMGITALFLSMSLDDAQQEGGITGMVTAGIEPESKEGTAQGLQQGLEDMGFDRVRDDGVSVE